MARRRFSVGQLKAISTMSGNASVVWFGAGFVGPILNNTFTNEKFLFNLIVSIVMTICFAFFSLEIVKHVQS